MSARLKERPAASRMPHRWGYAMGLLVVIAVVAPLPLASRELCVWIGRSFNTTFLTLGVIALLWYSWRQRCARTLWEVIWAALIVNVIVYAVKYATSQWLHWGYRPSGNLYGFPSGHSASAFALAYLLNERWPRFGPLFYTAAALIAWSRLGAGAHYPYQIVCGIALGIGVGLLVARRFAPRLAARDASKAPTS